MVVLSKRGLAIRLHWFAVELQRMPIFERLLAGLAASNRNARGVSGTVAEGPDVCIIAVLIEGSVELYRTLSHMAKLFR